jgi:hypothetical protein
MGKDLSKQFSKDDITMDVCKPVIPAPLEVEIGRIIV